MKPSSIAVRLLLGILVLLLTACEAGAPVTTTTAGPIDVPEPTTTPEPTALPTATPVVLNDLPEIAEVNQRLAEGNYDRAVQILRRVTTAYPDLSAATDRLGEVYLAWGQELINTSSEQSQPLAQITLALEKFTSGLALALNDETLLQNLQREHDLARGYLEATNAQNAFTDASDADLSTRRAESERISNLFESLFEQRPDLPGLRERYVRALLTVAESLAPGTGEALSVEEEEARQEEVLTLCRRALDIEPTSREAADCVTTLSATPTPTPAPVPTRVPPTAVPVPSRLNVQLIDYNDAPGCLSMRVDNINAAGWTLTVDGTNLRGTFDGGNNVRVCGLPGNDITFTVRYPNGSPVPGGGGIPARGTAILVGTWR